MSYMHPAWLEGRRRYWTRPDSCRFFKPGSPEAKMPGWLDPWATRVRAKEAAEDAARAEAEAEQEAFERELKALRASHERAREMLAEVKYELAWRRFVRKYSPDQPRVPAGSAEGGRWTSGNNGPAAATQQDEQSEEPGARVILAGGIAKDQLNLTVQTFVSTFCVGSINRQLPGQFMGVTIADVMAEAQQGNSAARMCLKLLMQDRFRK